MPEGLTLISCLGSFSEENPRTGNPTKKGGRPFAAQPPFVLILTCYQPAIFLLADVVRRETAGLVPAKIAAGS